MVNITIACILYNKPNCLNVKEKYITDTNQSYEESKVCKSSMLTEIILPLYSVINSKIFSCVYLLEMNVKFIFIQCVNEIVIQNHIVYALEEIIF